MLSFALRARRSVSAEKEGKPAKQQRANVHVFFSHPVTPLSHASDSDGPEDTRPKLYGAPRCSNEVQSGKSRRIESAAKDNQKSAAREPQRNNHVH